MPAVDYEASWTPAARKDLDDIYDYYAAQASRGIAERLLSEIEKTAERVVARPFSGAPRPKFGAGVRSARSAPYLLIYRVETDLVVFLRVLHETRDLPAAFWSTEE